MVDDSSIAIELKVLWIV